MQEPVQWLERTFPGLVQFLLSPGTIVGLTSFSAVCFIASVVGASWAVGRLPVDYLLKKPAPARSSGRPVMLALRNTLGIVLVTLGVLMLVLPGQGVLTILAGLGVMDFRGKRRLERRLMLQPRVFSAVNRLRARSGHPRLLSPGDSQRPQRAGARRGTSAPRD